MWSHWRYIVLIGCMSWFMYDGYLNLLSWKNKLCGRALVKLMGTRLTQGSTLNQVHHQKGGRLVDARCQWSIFESGFLTSSQTNMKAPKTVWATELNTPLMISWIHTNTASSSSHHPQTTQTTQTDTMTKHGLITLWINLLTSMQLDDPLLSSLMKLIHHSDDMPTVFKADTHNTMTHSMTYYDDSMTHLEKVFVAQKVQMTLDIYQRVCFKMIHPQHLSSISSLSTSALHYFYCFPSYQPF